MRAKIWWQPTIRSGSLTRRPSFGLSLPIRQARAATAPSGTNAIFLDDEHDVVDRPGGPWHCFYTGRFLSGNHSRCESCCDSATILGRSSGRLMFARVVPEVVAAVARPRAAAVWPCPLHLVAPPRCDDPTIQRWMRWSDETVGRGDVCEQAFHNVCSVSTEPLRARRRGANNPATLLLEQIRSGVQRLLRREFYLDQMRLGRLRLRQRDPQHAQVVGRLDLLGIDRGRQSERPLEGAIGPLIAMDLLGLLLRHLRLRARDRQQVALDRDLHVLGPHSGYLRDQANDIGLLEDVHQRQPGGRRGLGYRPLGRA